jgi:hypothetical protein
MGVNYKVTPANASTATTFDLTDTSINPGAAPTSTPRQGGFTLRNRINFTNVALSDKKLFSSFAHATAATVGNVLRVLEVPERVLIKGVEIFAVRDETVPGSTAVLGAGGNHASTFATMAIGVNVEQRSVPLDNDSYSAITDLDLQLAAQEGMPAGGVFGEIPLLKAGSSCTFESAHVEAIDSAMSAPELGRVLTEKAATGSVIEGGVPSYFPLGGYIYLGCTDVTTGSVTASSNTLAASDYVYLTGVWEIQADCQYIPE